MDQFQDSVHPSEVVKWGVFDGFLVGLFIAILTVIWQKRDQILALSGSWEFGATLILILLVSAGGIVTLSIAFAHPLYSLMKKQYRDAALTIAVSVLTMLSMAAFVYWSAPWLKG